MLRRAAAVGEPCHACSVMALQPLVDVLARHAIYLGQRGNALAIDVILNQLDAEVHGFALFPRHCFLACRFGELKNLTLTKLLPMFPDRTVTPVPGLDRY